MKWTVRKKIIAGFLLVVVAGFVLLATAGSSLANKQALNNAVRELYDDANYLAASYRVNTGSVNRGQLEAMAFSANAEIWIADTRGSLLATTGEGDRSASLVGFRPSDGIDDHYMIGHFYSAFDEEMLSVYVPLSRDTTTNGYVIFHQKAEYYRKAADRSLHSAYIMFAVMSVLFLLFVIYLNVDIVMPRSPFSVAA